jgi:hypothetical protein
LFRYQRGDTVEAYNLRPLSDEKAELWVMTSLRDGSAARSYLETTFKTPDEAMLYLERKERSLLKEVDGRSCLIRPNESSQSNSL